MSVSFKADQDVERKIISILKVVSDFSKPVGSRIIAQHLREHGVELGERAVRYHLKLTDEHGLTQLVGNHDGRVITEKGLREIGSAMVTDKIGYAISRIEVLAFRTDFDYEKRRGVVPVNISVFPKPRFPEAVSIMAPVYAAGLCVSNLVGIISAGQRVGNIMVPEGHVGLASVCSIVINGSLLKAGIPMDSRFGGILQMRDRQPVRFTEIIHYDGCSLDPSEIFIKARMTSVGQAIRTGSGEIVANFREIPAQCRPLAEKVMTGLKAAGLNGVLKLGQTSEDVCEISVGLNKIGVVLVGGLNPVAAAVEAGIESENFSMSTVIDYGSLIDFSELTSKPSRVYSLPR
jgi:HTH-type transcriptional regulator, global nitrogen regulator NrpRI